MKVLPSVLQRELGMGPGLGGLEETGTLALLRVTFTWALLHDNMF